MTEHQIDPIHSVIISENEFEKIKSDAIIMSDEEIRRARELAAAIKAEKEAKAHDRKAKMRELEKKAILMQKKSDIEVATEAREAALRQAAAEKLDKNSDTVKLLTSMACKAAAYSLRDSQLEDKRKREEEEAEFNRRMDMVMEIDRLKDIQRRETDEKEKRAKRLEDRKVINDQIAERKRMQLLAIEAREQENFTMKKLMDKYKEQDEIAGAKQRELAERSRIEIMRSNEEFIARKQAMKEAQKKEVEDILIYQAMKDAELAKREAEEEAIAHAKKERQKKLLEQQEKAQSNAGKLDELRARRAAEEQERRMRAAEKEKAMKRKSEVKDLLESRARQAADKKVRDSRFKLQEEEEFKYALKYMQTMSAREEAERRAKMEKAIANREGVLSQVNAIHKKRQSDREKTMNEGSDFRQVTIAEQQRLQVIRDQMVSDLEAKGVRGKYLSEMKNFDIAKALRV